VVFSWGAARFTHYRTAGFKISKITQNFPFSEEEKQPTPLPDHCEALVSQKFYYLGRGLQSFAFMSEDCSVVLKIFNNRYQRKIYWYSLIPQGAPKVTYLRSKLKKNGSSYQIASHELHDQTAILFTHLHATNHLGKKITLVDKLGIEHQIKLDEFAFALQKKMTLAYPLLDSLISQGDIEKSKQALRSLIDLHLQRCQLGISDNDPLIRTNCGFINTQAHFIDLGPFAIDPSMKEPLTQRKEIEKITTSLKTWVARNHADLLPFVEETIQEILSHADPL
jgi:hypothetical protein